MILPNQKMDQITDLPTMITITYQNPGNLYDQISGVFPNPQSIASLYLALMLIDFSGRVNSFFYSSLTIERTILLKSSE